MKLLLIGSSVIDYIHENEKITIKPGGVFYSACGLSAIQNNPHDMFLLSEYNKDNFNMYSDVYKNFNLSLSSCVDQLPGIHLFLHKDKERTECYQNITEELLINKSLNLNEFDAIYINMITGYDVSLDTLEFIRSKFTKFIYIDIHSLARGMEADNMRNFRKIPQIERWLKCVDIIQVNETEFEMLSCKDTKEEILNSIFAFGTKAVIITKAEKGVEGHINTEGIFKSVYLDALKIDQANSVGCGDIFGSMFFYYYISTSNFEKSLKFANHSAGLFSSYKNVNEFKVQGNL